MKKTVEEAIRYDWPRKGNEFLEWLAKKLNSYPVPIEELCVDIGGYDDCYGSISGQLEVTYVREETEQERIDRENYDKRQKDWKRRQYEELKKEFEGK